ncbi:MAG: FHA domain-containing protein [Myxococcales bacterium]|nr:FHA domain-containing protein [Myxococcales bacterium]
MWKLLTRFGEAGEADFPLLDELTIGRAPDNAIWLDDPLVSRRHARIYLAGQAAFAVDLQSANGVFRNGERLTDPVELRPGDVLLIGGYKLLVTWSGQGPAPAPAGDESLDRTFHLTTQRPGAGELESPSAKKSDEPLAAKRAAPRPRAGCLLPLLAPVLLWLALRLW